jgi:hypothetical protein
MTVFAMPLELFRRLNAQITAAYTQNAVHAVPSVETIPKIRETLSFVDFVEKLSVIAIPLEIFRRLNAQITASYAQSTVHAVPSVETRQKLANLDQSSISTKNDRICHAVVDILALKRPNYCISRAEHRARYIKRRDKPKNPANLDHSSISSKNYP